MHACCPNEVKKHVLRYVKDSYWRQWETDSTVEEVNGLQLARASQDHDQKETCCTDEKLDSFEWTKDDKTSARGYKSQCTEVHRVYKCDGWEDIREQLNEEVRKCERMAVEDVSKKWFCEKGWIVGFSVEWERR